MEDKKEFDIEDLKELKNCLKNIQVQMKLRLKRL